MRMIDLICLRNNGWNGFGAEGLRGGKAGTLISCGSVRFVRIYHRIGVGNFGKTLRVGAFRLV